MGGTSLEGVEGGEGIGVCEGRAIERCGGVQGLVFQSVCREF